MKISINLLATVATAALISVCATVSWADTIKVVVVPDPNIPGKDLNITDLGPAAAPGNSVNSSVNERDFTDDPLDPSPSLSTGLTTTVVAPTGHTKGSRNTLTITIGGQTFERVKVSKDGTYTSVQEGGPTHATAPDASSTWLLAIIGFCGLAGYRQMLNRRSIA